MKQPAKIHKDTNPPSSARTRFQEAAGDDPIGFFAKLLDDFKHLFLLPFDLLTLRYRRFPMRIMAGLVVGLVYLLFPIDAIPDFIPVAGVLDDATVVSLCWAWLRKDLNHYRHWREARGRGIEGRASNRAKNRRHEKES